MGESRYHMELLLLLVGLGIGLVFGWLFKAARMSRVDSETDSYANVPPPAVIYEQGYVAGWQAAGSAADRSASVSATVDSHTAPFAAPQRPEVVRDATATVTFPARQTVAPKPQGAQAPLSSVKGQTSPGSSWRSDQPEPSVDAAATRAARDLRNINVTLFTASLLLIAATALFLGTEFPPFLRFGVVAVVAALFYGSGLWVYGHMERLRPAGQTFVGAALAMIPFSGLALNVLVIHNVGWSWLATAAVGAVAFMYAALRLRSKLVAYLSLPFMLSVVWAPGNVLGAGLVWYFAATICVATLLMVASRLRPSLAGRVYLQVIREVHGYIVPGAVLLSLFNLASLSSFDYLLITAAASLFYLVALWGTSSSREAALNVYSLRLTVVLMALSAAAAFDAGGAAMVSVAAGCVSLQAIVVAFLPQRLAATFGGHLSDLARFAPTVEEEAEVVKQPAPPLTEQRQALALRRWQIVDACWSFAVALGFNIVALYIWPSSESGPTTILSVVVATLVVTMILAWRMRGHRVVLVPAALVLVVFLSGQELWSFEIVLALVLVYTAFRAVMAVPGSTMRTLYRLASRGLVVVASGLLVADYWPSDDSLSSGQLAIFVMIVVLVLNQLISLVQRLQKRTLQSPAYVIVGAGVLGYTLAVVLLTGSAPQGMQIGSLWLTLAGAVVPSILLFRQNPWLEAVPPVSLATTALFGALVFQVHDYELLLIAALGYLLLMASHHEDSIVRRSYRYVAIGMTAGTASVFTLGHWPETQDAGSVTMSLLVLSAGFLACQLASLVMLRRDRQPARFIAVVTTTYLVLSIGPAAALADLDGPEWAAVSSMWILLLGAVISGVVLLNRVRWIGLPAAAAFPLTALLATGVFDVLEYEILLAVGVLYCLTLAVRHRGSAARGAYFLAGQIQLTLLTSVCLWDLKVSVHTYVTVFVLSLLVQELLRTVFRHYTRDLGYQRASGSLTIVLLIAAHPVYFTATGVEAQRGVTATSLAALFLVLLVISTWSTKRLRLLALSCVPIMLVVFSSVLPFSADGWLGAAELSHGHVAASALSLGVTGWLVRQTTAVGRRHVIAATVAVWVFILEGSLFALAAGGWAPAVALLLAAAIVLLESHTWNRPSLYAIGAVLTIAACWFAGAESRRALPLDMTLWELQLMAHGSAAALIYGWLLIRGRSRIGELRRRYAAVTVNVALAFGALVAMTEDRIAVVASVLLVVAAVLIVFEVPRQRRQLAGRIVFLVAVFAAERIWTYLDPDVSLFWLAQGWVGATALIAIYGWGGSGHRAGYGWMLAAASILSISGLMAMLTQDSGHQIWALLGHAVLLFTGVLWPSRTFTWWGAAGLSLAALWFLRGYTFVLLALLAVALISFAVWRLYRSKDSISS